MPISVTITTDTRQPFVELMTVFMALASSMEKLGFP